MNVLLFGATGMVGAGVLRECLRDPDVGLVQTIGRTPTNQHDPKLREIVHPNLWDYTSIESQLSNFDACFFCLGVASAGMSEQEYTRLTHDLTLAAAKTLARLNPQMTFVFVSGAGTDGTGQGRLMWARVKGRTENDLRQLPFKAVYSFRPGVIQPLHGIRSRTPLYRKSVHGARAPAAAGSIALSEPDSHDGADWAGDARRRQARVARSRPGSARHRPREHRRSGEVEQEIRS